MNRINSRLCTFSKYETMSLQVLFVKNTLLKVLVKICQVAVEKLYEPLNCTRHRYPNRLNISSRFFMTTRVTALLCTYVYKWAVPTRNEASQNERNSETRSGKEIMLATARSLLRGLPGKKGPPEMDTRHLI